MAINDDYNLMESTQKKFFNQHTSTELVNILKFDSYDQM
jgi:hypothetical protein